MNANMPTSPVTSKLKGNFFTVPTEDKAERHKNSSAWPAA